MINVKVAPRPREYSTKWFETPQTVIRFKYIPLPKDFDEMALRMQHKCFISSYFPRGLREISYLGRTG